MKQAVIIAACFLFTNVLGFSAEKIVDLPFEYLVIPIIIPIRSLQKEESNASK